MSLTKSSATRQKAHLPATLAFLKNGHNSNLRACCTSVRYLSRPSLVLAKPLRPRSAAWWFSFVANFNSILLGCTPVTWVEACVITNCYCMVVTTLVRNLIWPYNNSVLSHYTSSFFCLTLLGLEAREMQVEVALLLYGRIGQGLHNPAHHLVHVLGYHHSKAFFHQVAKIWPIKSLVYITIFLIWVKT